MEEHLFPVRNKEKVGFINRWGKIIIDFEFEEATAFSEGLARIYYKDKVGCIDMKGQMVIPTQFEGVREFSEGLAAVSVEEKYGYINRDGLIVIPPTFYNVGSFQNGFANIMSDIMSASSFINKEGTVVLTEKVSLTSAYNEGLINCTGLLLPDLTRVIAARN